jgi:precorrin-2 dehydrogenase / sirohydrochlorin ferrochelatase
MTATCYPIALVLDGKPCLVVGGGEIADGKLDALLLAGALVTVVSPEVRPRIAALAADGQITLQQRPYQTSDLDATYLVIAATDDRPLNARVVTEARAAGILTQAVDDIPYCDFFAVAIVRRGDLQLGISTNGRSPAFARWMRERLDTELPAEYGDLLAVLGDVRDSIKARGPIPAYEHWQEAITDDVLAALGAGDRETATARIYERVSAGVDSAAVHAGGAQ